VGGLTDIVDNVAEAVAAAHRSDWARVVAGLIRVTGNWTLAEDAAQDAFTAALVAWPRDGVPERPAAWLTTAARNRAIDRLRSASSERSRQEAVAMTDDVGDQPGDDDRLRLIFTSCHPALPMAGRVALTLRTVGGLSVADVARSFLVTEATMSQRLVRARRKIEHARIPYRVPPPELLEERLEGALAVLYLAFNTGYSDVERTEVGDSAISVTQSLVDLMPRESEARGLLALMLFQHSRRVARMSAGRELLTLEEQDRSRWVGADVERGRRELAVAGGRGPYVLQALIAQCHATAESATATDWTRVIRLYDELIELTPTPVVALNRAIAVGLGESPEMGLLLIDELADRLRDFHLLPAARADLLIRAGRRNEAIASLDRAIEIAPTELDRAQLERRRTSVMS
jgi:RNA polymerase sigma-70 factor (ECF subfamily)